MLLGVLRSRILVHAIECRGIAACNGLVSGFTALAANHALTGADPHRTASIRLLRARASSVCIDNECDLSGGWAHAGPCEPCACPHRHAIEECPEPRQGRRP